MTGIAWMDEVGLADRHLLAEVVARHPQVVAVAAGHLHRVITTRFAGTVAACTASTGAQLALALDGTPYGYVDEAPLGGAAPVDGHRRPGHAHQRGGRTAGVAAAVGTGARRELSYLLWKWVKVRAPMGASASRSSDDWSP